MALSVRLGVDIGGSHVAAVTLDARGRVRASVVQPHNPQNGAEGTLQAVRAAADGATAFERCRVVGTVGVAFPGVLEGRKGRVTFAPNNPDWLGRSAPQMLSKALGRRVLVENDANCAAWAEHELGRGPPSDLLYVVLGTGIGGGLVMGGVLQRGVWGTGGELGHVRVHGFARRCGCGKRGCVEALAGGRALAETAVRLARSSPRSGLGRALRERAGSALTAWDLLRLAEEGDIACRRARDTAAEALGEVLGSVVNVLGVPRVVLGGRLLHKAPGYEQGIRRAFQASLLPSLRGRVRFCRSRSWKHRNSMGAILLARTRKSGR
ncbi:MAG: ROK family protein [Euryarchaeota archaeon]|nr:ROK family protein [Euryarchaeota archaeon]MDE1837123.1 ROK family protein [Euryarchaeota archaeon]MDE1879665.1 ROK family protein [Euryarchaeota archaeon]MDE2045191.1 ROK family protein [Thermoplasmata archaeon]